MPWGALWLHGPALAHWPHDEGGILLPQPWPGHSFLSGIRGSLHAPAGSSNKFRRSVPVDNKNRCIVDANFSVGEPLPHPSSRWPWALSVDGAGAEDGGKQQGPGQIDPPRLGSAGSPAPCLPPRLGPRGPSSTPASLITSQPLSLLLPNEKAKETSPPLKSVCGVVVPSFSPTSPARRRFPVSGFVGSRQTGTQVFFFSCDLKAIRDSSLLD